MAKCVDNERLGRIGCGQEYTGELQHSVAKVPWSQYPDGMAHITGSASTIEKCWHGNTMVHPNTMGFTQDAKGIWRQPQSKSMAKWLKELNE